MQVYIRTFGRSLLSRIDKRFYLDNPRLKGAIIQQIELVDDRIIVIILCWVDGGQFRVVASMPTHSI